MALVFKKHLDKNSSNSLKVHYLSLLLTLH
jgi:hypothetical protein